LSLKLAPDSATADRAKKLTHTKFWRTLAGNPSIIWGECKSKGLTYYKVAFQKKTQTFKCNCASRKYPCKHSLALSILLTDQLDAFTITEDLPSWVIEWVEKGAPATKDLSPERVQANAENRQKNFSKRLDRMVAGLDELENWLLDTLRQGIAALEQQPFSYWMAISARIHDAQLSAIGKRIKNIPVLIGTDEDWPAKVLSELTAYYLLIRGLRKMDELPLNIQQDLLTVAGVSTKKEELFQYGQTVKDTWMILGQIEGVEDRLNYRRTWVLGFETKRYGLILDYAYAPLRIAVKEKQVLDRRVKRIVGFETFTQFLAFYTKNLAANPWQIAFPCSLEAVRPVLEKDQLFLLDKEQNIIPVFQNEKAKWKILAASGGHAVNIFGEWSGENFSPLSLTIGQQFVGL